MMKKVFFALPRYAHREQETDVTLQALIDRKGDFEIKEVREIVGRSAISRARNDLCTEFMASDCDYLFFMDSDMTWIPQDEKEPNPIETLVKDDKDIISPPMTTRIMPIRPAWRPFSRRDLDIWKHEKPFKVLHTGSAFMLIRRNVIETLIKKGHAAPFMPVYCHDEKVETSDDVAFCRRALQCGFTIWVEPRIRIGHVGKYAFSVEDVKNLLQEEAAKG